MTQPKRLIIKEAIEAGNATKESLMKLAEVSSASLATNFTYLRLMGFYPVKGDDGTFRFVNEEEWDSIQAARAEAASNRKAPGKAKTPHEIIDAAEKRLTKCQKAVETAAEKHATFDNEITQLREVIANAEYRLAEIALDAVIAEHGDSVEDEEVEDEEVEEVEEDELV